MKLLTLNCHSWQEKDQLDKIKYLAKTIKEKQYDVIALQEVSQRVDTKLLYENIREDNFVYLLKKELEALGEYDYTFVWDFSHIGYDIYEEGLAIVTKHKIKESRSFYVSQSSDKNNYRSRNIIEATISIDNKEYSFLSCHLGWWGDTYEPFKYQADMLIKNIKKNSFIMGDFNNNALVRNEGYDYLIGLGLVDTFLIATKKDSGITVDGEIDGWEKCKESKRLDLILTSNKYSKITSSKVIFNKKNKIIISDHFGVEVIL
ncbi:endonuclease/exonuclease/phosphatase family protein [Clostridium carnis]